VHLRATGDATGEQTDTFVQLAQAQADVLLVVDDSGSMADKQANLANNFAAFMNYATSAHVDYHLGVTSTTVDTDGGVLCVPIIGCQAVPGANSLAPAGVLYRDATRNVPAILTPNDPTPAQTFSKMVKLGTDGSGIEQGLAAATLALSEPLISHENKGFLRADANLAVVVVSDAADQSSQPVSYYLDLLLNVKGVNRRSQFTFSNIGPYLTAPPPNCTYDDSRDPTRYKAVVDATSGVAAEICTTDWSAPLTRLGNIAFGYRTQFFLNAVPDLTGSHTITVRRNGGLQALSMTCPGSTVCFDARSNSIQFNAAAAPAGGDTVTVTYSNGCF
jgi:hypothetical protein